MAHVDCIKLITVPLSMSHHSTRSHFGHCTTPDLYCPFARKPSLRSLRSDFSWSLSHGSNSDNCNTLALFAVAIESTSRPMAKTTSCRNTSDRIGRPISLRNAGKPPRRGFRKYCKHNQYMCVKLWHNIKQKCTLRAAFHPPSPWLPFALIASFNISITLCVFAAVLPPYCPPGGVPKHR